MGVRSKNRPNIPNRAMNIFGMFVLSYITCCHRCPPHPPHLTPTSTRFCSSPPNPPSSRHSSTDPPNEPNRTRRSRRGCFAWQSRPESWGKTSAMGGSQGAVCQEGNMYKLRHHHLNPERPINLYILPSGGSPTPPRLWGYNQSNLDSGE